MNIISNVKNMSLSAGAYILFSFVLFLNLYLITQSVPLEALGLYGLANTAANSARMLDLFGSRAVAFEIAERGVHKSTNILVITITISFLITTFISTAFAIYFIIPTLTMQDFDNYFTLEINKFTTMIVLSVPIAVFCQILKAFFDGHNLSKQRAIIEIGSTIIMFFLMMVIYINDSFEHLLFVPFYLNILQFICFILLSGQSLKYFHLQSLLDDTRHLIRRSLKIQLVSMLSIPTELILKTLILNEYGAFNLGIFEILQKIFNAIRGLCVSVCRVFYYHMVKYTVNVETLTKIMGIVLASYILILPIIHLINAHGLGLVGPDYILMFTCVAATYGAYTMNLGIHLLAESKHIYKYNFLQSMLILTFLSIFVFQEKLHFSLLYWVGIVWFSIAIFSSMNLYSYFTLVANSKNLKDVGDI